MHLESPASCSISCSAKSSPCWPTGSHSSKNANPSHTTWHTHCCCPLIRCTAPLAAGTLLRLSEFRKTHVVFFSTIRLYYNISFCPHTFPLYSNTWSEIWSSLCSGLSIPHFPWSSISISTSLRLRRTGIHLCWTPWSTLDSQRPTRPCLLKWLWLDHQNLEKPPVSLKTAGKWSTHSYCFYNPSARFSVIHSLLTLRYLFSGTDVCPEIWLGPAVHRQCYAHSA